MRTRSSLSGAAKLLHLRLTAYWRKGRSVGLCRHRTDRYAAQSTGTMSAWPARVQSPNQWSGTFGSLMCYAIVRR